MRHLSPIAAAATAAALVFACSEVDGIAPRLDLDGPTLRQQVQRRGMKGPLESGSSVTEEQRAEAAAHGLGSVELVGDVARLPLTSPQRAKLDAEVWSEETFAVELTTDQLLVLRRLIQGAAGRSSVDLVFAPGARIAPLAVPAGESQPVALDVVRRTWTPGEDVLEPEAWWQALAEWRASAGRVRWVTFLPTFTVFEGGVARVELEWQVNVELPGGGLRHDVGIWTSEWVAPDGAERSASSLGWRCRSLRPLEGTTLESSRVAFVDVTGEALPDGHYSPLVAHAPEGKEHYRGIALVDVDQDGDLDIVCSIPNALLVNDGNGVFADVTEAAGIVQEKGFTGVQAADFDRDGDIDLVFTGKRRPAALYLQDAPLEFRATTIPASRSDNHPASITAHDVDRDGWLDLYVCGYGPLVNPGPEHAYDAKNARNNQMLRGGPNGFTDVTEAWGLWGESSRWAFIGSFGDVDEDGDDDLYVANDFGPNVLYRRVQVSPPRFEAEIEPLDRYDASFSMSATWADLDGDLDLDMYVSNMESTEVRRIERLPGNQAGDARDRELREIMSNGNALLMNEREGERRVLVEQDSARGARDAKWAWGTALFDWDLDGDLDIQCVNGFRSIGIDDGRDWDSVWWRYAAADMKRHPDLWVESLTRHYPESARAGWSWDGFQRSVFYLNDGSARFEQIAPVLGLDQVADGRALAMGDIDGDGDMDLVGGNVNAPHLYVLRNDTRTRGHFVWVELVPSEHRSAAGARILVTAGDRTLRRDVMLGEGFVSQHELARHFGLADAERIERIEVRWPDGATSVFEDLAVDRRYRLRQEGEELTDVPLRPLNFNATGRMGPVEWSNDEHQIELVLDPIDDVVGACIVPSPLGPTPSPTFVRAVVLWDPADESSRGELARLAELVGIEAFDVVVVTPEGAPPPQLPDGLSARHARFANEAARARLLAALGQWCGTHHQPWPVVLYCAQGQVRAVSRGAIVPERIRALR